MPEGPEVETVRRTLLPHVVGARLGRAIVSRKALRTPVTARRFAPFDGAVVIDVKRHGKLMWLVVDDERGIWVRLGMTGQLTVVPRDAQRKPHTHVRLHLVHDNNDNNELRYVDPRRFGEVVPFTSRDALDEQRAQLGPDGLSLSDDDRVVVATALRKTDRAIKEALLDQRVIAGVGNIYAAEACFVARLNPERAGSSLSTKQALALADAAAAVLATAVVHNGTSFSNYVDAMGRQGDNYAHVFVFQREGKPCRVCARPIERVVQGARSTFWCRRCQR